MTTDLRPLFILLFTTALVFALYAVRVLGPSDLMDNDQQRPAAYVMDALYNGHWTVMTDHLGQIMSKPPVSTWWTAYLALPFHRVNLWLLYLPCVFSTLFIVWIILSAGTHHFGRLAAFLAALAYIMSPIVNKQIALARSDPVFALMVFATAMALYRVWIRGRGWWLVGLLAALATLTKGPLGIVLAAGGLAAVWPERRSDSPVRLRGHPWLGLLLMVGLPALWFWAAYQEVGQPLIDKMIGAELLGHAVSGDRGDLPFVNFYKPPLYFISRYLPWSLVACYGLWRVLKRPAESPIERRFERFLFGYIAIGVGIFSLAPHQRPDHLFPLIPAAALLAGRELGHWLENCSTKRVIVGTTALAMVFLVGVGGYANYVRAKDVKVRQTEAVRKFAVDSGDALDLINARGTVRAILQVPTQPSEPDVPFAFDFFIADRYRVFRNSFPVHSANIRSFVAPVTWIRDNCGAEVIPEDLDAMSEEIDGLHLGMASIRYLPRTSRLESIGKVVVRSQADSRFLGLTTLISWPLQIAFVLLASFLTLKSLSRGRIARQGLMP